MIELRRMTAQELKDQEVRYNYAQALGHRMLTASTTQGVCYVGFVTGSEEEALDDLHTRLPHARLTPSADEQQQRAVAWMEGETGLAVRLHVSATDFQWKVWQALLQVAPGTTATYADIARRIGHPKACRAVGSAVGQNPVAVLIPCHRIVRTNGGWGGYHWGIDIKRCLLLRERTNH